MRIYIDSANVEDIKLMIKRLPVDGVTTNPSLLAKEKNNPMKQLKAIKEVLEDHMELHAQVISAKAEEMIKEAEYMREHLGENLYIKVPVTPDGIEAIKELHKRGVNITATAIYTPMQAVLAAKAGARWVAPYVNRLDMIGADGVLVATTIHDILSQINDKAGVLAASFKNVQQILNLSEIGVGAVTVSPDLLKEILYHPLTDKAVYDFTNDFYKITQEGASMLGL